MYVCVCEFLSGGREGDVICKFVGLFWCILCEGVEESFYESGELGWVLVLLCCLICVFCIVCYFIKYYVLNILCFFVWDLWWKECEFGWCCLWGVVGDDCIVCWLMLWVLYVW